MPKPSLTYDHSEITRLIKEDAIRLGYTNVEVRLEKAPVNQLALMQGSFVGSPESYRAVVTADNFQPRS